MMHTYQNHCENIVNIVLQDKSVNSSMQCTEIKTHVLFHKFYTKNDSFKKNETPQALNLH